MRLIVAVVCVTGLLASCACAWASVASPLTVTATTGTGQVATWTYDWSGGQTSFCLPGIVELRAADNTLIGTITGLTCEMPTDPAIFLNFAVHAVVDANFTIDSGELVFPQIDIPAAFATAATTLTADGNGATWTGNFAGKGFQATYNGGTVFATLDSTFVSPANTSTVQEERFPATGNTIIGVPVTSMRSQWDFGLTGGDDASGTSRYEIEPVPDASTLVLALAGIAPIAGCFLRRRH